MERLAERITDFFVANNAAKPEWKPLYIAGLKLILSEVLNFLLVLAAGAFLSSLYDSFLYLLTFCSVRGFSGGFHAKKHWICRAVMVGTFLLILIAKGPAVRTWPRILPSIGGAALFIIGRFSPIEHPNKYLSEEKKRKNRRKAFWVSVAYFIAAWIFLLLGREEGMIILLTLAAVAFLMPVGSLANARDREHTKDSLEENEGVWE